MRSRLGGLWLVCAFLVVASSAPRAQGVIEPQEGAEVLPDGPLQLRVYVGTASLELGDIEARFDEAVDLVRTQGFPFPVQRDFSPQVVFGGEAVYRVLDPRGSRPGLALGLGVERAYTEAFAGYEDFSGTLDLEQEAGGTLLEGIVQAQWPVYGPVSVALTARAGRLRTRSVLRETFDLVGLDRKTVTESQFEGTAFALGGGVSLRYVWRFLGLSAEVGYRRAEAAEADLTLSTETPAFSDTAEIEAVETSETLSGLRLTVGAFFTL